MIDWPVGIVTGPHVHGIGFGAPLGWNCAIPETDADQLFQWLTRSPPTPSQCQPLAGVYHAIQPRVETGVGDLVVKSGSTRYACGAPASLMHCRWPSVQKPFAAGGFP